MNFVLGIATVILASSGCQKKTEVDKLKSFSEQIQEHIEPQPEKIEDFPLVTLTEEQLKIKRAGGCVVCDREHEDPNMRSF